MSALSRLVSSLPVAILTSERSSSGTGLVQARYFRSCEESFAPHFCGHVIITQAAWCDLCARFCSHVLLFLLLGFLCVDRRHLVQEKLLFFFYFVVIFSGEPVDIINYTDFSKKFTKNKLCLCMMSCSCLFAREHAFVYAGVSITWPVIVTKCAHQRRHLTAPLSCEPEPHVQLIRTNQRAVIRAWPGEDGGTVVGGILWPMISGSDWWWGRGGKSHFWTFSFSFTWRFVCSVWANRLWMK